MTTLDSTISRRRLWIGVLAAPTAWLIAEGVGYVVSSRLCEPATALALTSIGSRARVAHFAVCLVCLFIALIGFGAALANTRAVRALHAKIGANADSVSHLGRTAFMSYGGAFASGLFTLGILLFATPGIIVNVCNQAR